MKNKRDLFAVSLFILVSLLVWLAFDLKPLWGFSLFSLLPVTYFGFRKKLPQKRILYGSVTLGLILGSFFDLIQSFNKAWVVNLVIPWKIFGVLPIDNILGYFFMTLLVLTFYEYFFVPATVIAQRFYRANILIIIIVLAVFMTFAIRPNWFLLPYSYLIGGMVAALVTIIGLIRHPELLKNTLLAGTYFILVWLFVELTALKTGGWSFQGKYLGWVDISGLRFPFEELFFWMFWYTPYLIVTYEYLMRDKKKL